MKILEIINNNLNIKKYLVILVMIIVIKKVRKITMKRRLFKILATGLMVSEALEAAKLLEEKGVKARVVNVSTIKPLDTETVLKAAKECKFIVTSEEHSVIGGLGSAVSEYLSEVHPTKIVKHGIQDVFGQSADGETMLTNYGLRAKDIAEIVLKNI